MNIKGTEIPNPPEGFEIVTDVRELKQRTWLYFSETSSSWNPILSADEESLFQMGDVLCAKPVNREAKYCAFQIGGAVKISGTWFEINAQRRVVLGDYSHAPEELNDVIQGYIPPKKATKKVHSFEVQVIGCSYEQAETVLRERLGHDEDYGFPYTLNW